jgi:ATP-dependent Clp protease ATP-binding subunit ClpC
VRTPRLSPESERVLTVAAQERMAFGHRYLGVEHLALALLRERREEVEQAFAAAYADVRRFEDSLRREIGSFLESGSPDDLGATPRCREVLDLAGRMAEMRGVATVQPEHLFVALLREGRSVPVRILRALEADLGALEDALSSEPEARPSATPVLDGFGRDLTAMARRGELAPVVGREAELALVLQVLLRKSKNNPVLVGEAGVGKTAVVEGLARLLASPECPQPLLERRVIELSMASIVAGTKFRGDFEQRLLALIEEVRTHPDVILFLDELHTLVGAGATSDGSMDAGNLLKPALARGELRCVGATTIEEYRRYVEADPALERRFAKVLVDEPTPAMALEILERLRPTLEDHHEVAIRPQALEAAIDLTTRHVLDRRLPDKAIDVLDQTCARRRLERYTAAGGEQQAAIDEVDVARTLAQWTGIPLERLSGEAARDLLNLESELRALVVGQDAAVKAVARTILTARAGLADPNRPLGVFFFAGPTGVGKTWLAKCLARILFADAKRLVRVDMSEYAQEHTVSNLVGAPPGYVGHEREGLLISALRTHPHSVVLFDEVEKAHPKVFDLFLQIFDEGRLTGTRGQVADFRQAVVILTSNLPLGPTVSRRVGFGEQEVEVALDPRNALAQHLRPELVNRIDEIVSFAPLAPGVLRAIVDRLIGDIEDRMAERRIVLELDEAVYGHLIELADCSRYGARELQRVIDRQVRQPLAEAILQTGGEAARVAVSIAGGALSFDVRKEELSA